MSAAQAPVWYDPAAEKALVGGAVLYPERIEAVAADVAPEHFHDHGHRTLWRAVTELLEEGLGRLDEVLVADRCRRIDPSFSAAVLVSVVADAVAPRREHAEIVLRYAAVRQTWALLTESRQKLTEGEDPYDLAASLAPRLDAIGGPAGDEPEALTLPELLAQADQAAPWVVPGLLRLDWRAIIVGGEGKGKSTLLRQLAVCAGQGIHPLTFAPVHPVRALVVDAENSKAAIAETGARLDEQARRAAGDRYDPERVRVWSRPSGLDLREPRDRAAFVRELRAHRPQLVVAGPVYKLGHRRRNESYEDAAEGVQEVLDDLRVRFGFGLVLETHAPKGDGFGAREMAPFGSQRWLAWPELGIGLYPDTREKGSTDLIVRRFRGDRIPSDWPDRLCRGQVWPFEGVWRNGLRAAG